MAPIQSSQCQRPMCCDVQSSSRHLSSVALRCTPRSVSISCTAVPLQPLVGARRVQSISLPSRTLQLRRLQRRVQSVPEVLEAVRTAYGKPGAGLSHGVPGTARTWLRLQTKPSLLSWLQAVGTSSRILHMTKGSRSFSPFDRRTADGERGMSIQPAGR